MGDLDVEFEESNLVPGQKFAKETPELLERALGKFRQMANSVSGETRSDNYLMKFLRARKFDLDRSLKLLRDHEEYRDKVHVQYACLYLFPFFFRFIPPYPTTYL